MRKPDLTKLGFFDRAVENCVVVSIPSGATPKFIKVKLPGIEGAVIDAWWTGNPALEVDSSVTLRYRPDNQAQYTIIGGGSGAGKVSSLDAPDGDPAPAWSVDNSGNLSNPGGGILDLTGVADALVLDTDNDTSLSSPTDDQIDIEVGGSDRLRITSTALLLLTPTVIDLDGIADALVLDTDADTSISAPTDDQIDIELAGADVFHLNSTGIGVGMVPERDFDALREAGSNTVVRLSNYGSGTNAFQAREAAGSISSPSATTSGATLFSLGALGHDGSAFEAANRAVILFVAAETHSGSAQGARLQFETTANGGTTRTEKMRIADNGDVGIGTTSPATKLDIDGGLATRQSGVTLSNGLNSDITVGNRSFIRITGPTGAFSLGGFTGGVNGQVLRVFNDVAQTMTIVNEDGSSTAANRITTLTGGNVALRTTGRSFATFIYSSANSRWILTATN